MLSIAIKNIILVVLIILILHLLIKIYVPHDARESKEGFEDSMKKCTTKPTAELDEYFGCKPAPEFKCEVKEGGDAKLPTNIEPVMMQFDSSSKCTGKEGVPLEGTTCEVKFNEPGYEKPLKSSCVLEQPNPNIFLLLNEYENENQMNHEKWMDNIDMYDQFGSSYVGYEQQCDL